VYSKAVYFVSLDSETLPYTSSYFIVLLQTTGTREVN